MQSGQTPSCREEARYRVVARAALIAAIAAMFVAMPLSVTWKGWHPGLGWNDAAAKDGNGKGGGHGNGGGKGSGGGKGKGKSEKGAAGPGKGAGIGQRRVDPAVRFSLRMGGTIEVVHGNGMRERIRAGRYLMRDSKGRTIIERAATNKDLRRLRNLEG